MCLHCVNIIAILKICCYYLLCKTCTNQHLHVSFPSYGMNYSDGNVQIVLNICHIYVYLFSQFNYGICVSYLQWFIDMFSKITGFVK